MVTCYIIDLSFAITISCWFGACAALQPFISAGLGKPKGKSALRLLSCLSNQAVQLQLIWNKDQFLIGEKKNQGQVQAMAYSAVGANDVDPVLERTILLKQESCIYKIPASQVTPHWSGFWPLTKVWQNWPQSKLFTASDTIFWWHNSICCPIHMVWSVSNLWHGLTQV